MSCLAEFIKCNVLHTNLGCCKCRLLFCFKGKKKSPIVYIDRHFKILLTTRHRRHSHSLAIETTVISVSVIKKKKEGWFLEHCQSVTFCPNPKDRVCPNTLLKALSNFHDCRQSLHTLGQIWNPESTNTLMS